MCLAASQQEGKKTAFSICDCMDFRVAPPAHRWKTVPQGAATSVWSGFVAPADLVGGKFCEDCHVADVVEGAELRGGVRAYALDPDHPKALWAKSEEMVGERFP